MRRECDGGGVDSFNLVFAIKACVGLGLLENGGSDSRIGDEEWVG